MRVVALLFGLALAAPGSARAGLEADGPAEVERHGVWTLTLVQRPAEGAPPTGNPWTTYFPRAEVVTPSGRTLTFDGFYFDVDTWQVRFAPDELGPHAFRVTLGEDQAKGSFEVFESGRQGFLRVHPDNPYRFVTDDGALFPAFGFGGCLAQNPVDPPAAPGAVPDDEGFWIDGFGDFDQDAYIRRTLLASGANLYRWSVYNCAWAPWDRIVDGVGDRYSIARGRWGDDWVRALRRHGIRVMMDMFGFGWNADRLESPLSAPIGEAATRPELAKAYVRYIVARYAAYVDVWEIGNESAPADAWISAVAGYIHEYDPYRQDAACRRPAVTRRCRHPISLSYARPDHPEIEIHAPHHYTDSDLRRDDLDVTEALFDGVPSEPQRFPMARYPKPVVFGEAGESSGGPRAESRAGARITAWTAFFNQATVVFWEFGYRFRDGTSPNFVLALDDDVRSSLHTQRDFHDLVDADARPPRGVPAPGQVSYRRAAEGVRVYDLAGATSTYAYLVSEGCARNRPVSGLALDVTFAAAGTAAWYDPSAGRFVGTFPVKEGRMRVTAPRFTCDLALVAKPAFRPLVRAGPDQRVRLEEGAAIRLRGRVLDVDSEAVTTAWRVLRGPEVTFGDAAAADTWARFTATGTYLLALEASDGTATARDTVTVEVSGRPVADAPPRVAPQRVTLRFRLDGDLTSLTVNGRSVQPSERGDLSLDFAVGEVPRRVVVEAVARDGSRVRRVVTLDAEAVSP